MIDKHRDNETDMEFLAKVNRDMQMETAKANMENMVRVSRYAYDAAIEQGYTEAQAFGFASVVFQHFLRVAESNRPKN